MSKTKDKNELILETINNLFFVSDRLHILLNYWLNEKNISSAELSMLKRLSVDKYVYLKEFRKSIYVQKNSLSRIITKMYRKSYIKRHLDEDDGRSIIISITKKGEDKYTEVTKFLIAKLKGIFDDLGEDFSKDLLNMLFNIKYKFIERLFSKYWDTTQMEKNKGGI